MGGPRVPPLTGLDTPTNAAYLAALIDGEGTIGIYRANGVRSLSPSFYVQVTVVNTNTDLMAWLSENIGGRVDKRSDTTSRDPRHKHPYHWRVHGPNAELLLNAVRPYLVCKGSQADVALQLRAMHQAGRVLTPEDVAARQALKDRMHVLNARGVPSTS